MRLYEINQQIEELTENLIDPETGELDEDILAQLDALEMDREQKIENALCLSKNLMSDGEQLIGESKALKERGEAKFRKAESIRNWISHVLDGEPFETTRVAVKWRKSQTVEITDELAVPDEYKKFAVTSKPDKLKLKGDLKQGVRIPGATLVDKLNMNVK